MTKETKCLFVRAMLAGHKRAEKWPESTREVMVRNNHEELLPSMWIPGNGVFGSPYPFYWILDEETNTAYTVLGDPEDLTGDGQAD